MKINDTYTIDTANADDEYLYVDVQGMGSVCIKTTAEGIVVDIYPFHVFSEPVASTYAHISDLEGE